MEPNNPDNQQPLIYRIADAAGVFHIVAPVNHTHTYQDVQGLAGELNELWSGLNEKANAEDVTEALAAKQDALTFDTTPTANSTNPVTSGGVKAAIDNKLDNKTIDSAPANHANNLISSKAVYDALQDKADWGTLGRHGSHANVEILMDEDSKAYISVTAEEETADLIEENIPNLRRALSDPDSTPTANSNNLVTSGGVKAALGGKADTNHTHTPTEVQGVIPSFVEWTGQTLDLDTIIDGTWGMVRIMIYNNDSTDTTFGNLFESLESLPIHLNANVATAIETQHYALCTIYKMDKSQTPSEHDHDLCYFITLDGVFNDGNPSV